MVFPLPEEDVPPTRMRILVDGKPESREIDRWKIMLDESDVLSTRPIPVLKPGETLVYNELTGDCCIFTTSWKGV